MPAVPVAGATGTRGRGVGAAGTGCRPRQPYQLAAGAEARHVPAGWPGHPAARACCLATPRGPRAVRASARTAAACGTAAAAAVPLAEAGTGPWCAAPRPVPSGHPRGRWPHVPGQPGLPGRTYQAWPARPPAWRPALVGVPAVPGLAHVRGCPDPRPRQPGLRPWRPAVGLGPAYVRGQRPGPGTRLPGSGSQPWCQPFPVPGLATGRGGTTYGYGPGRRGRATQPGQEAACGTQASLLPAATQVLAVWPAAMARPPHGHAHGEAWPWWPGQYR